MAAIAAACRDAGAGYVVLTAKHHDGFCLLANRFDTSAKGPLPRGPRHRRRLANGGPRRRNAHGPVLLRRLRLAPQRRC